MGSSKTSSKADAWATQIPSEPGEGETAERAAAPGPPPRVTPFPFVAQWVRAQPAVAVPVLTVAAGAVALRLGAWFTHTVRGGWSDAVDVPGTFMPATGVLTPIILVLAGAAVDVALTGLIVAALEAVNTAATERRPFIALVVATGLVELALNPRQAAWPGRVAWAIAGAAGVVVLVGLWKVARYGGRRLQRRRAALAARSAGAASGRRAGRLELRSRGSAEVAAVLAVGVAVLLGVGLVGRFAGEYAARSGGRWVLDAPGPTVLVFVDGERVAERPVRRIDASTFQPCGQVRLRSLGEDGLRMRHVPDFGRVVDPPAGASPTC